jgi:hypothetical protein
VYYAPLKGNAPAFWLQAFSCRDFSLALGGWIVYPHFRQRKLQRPVHF